MKIYYVYHSCFIVETESSFLIFDYYTNKKDIKQDFDFDELLKNIYASNKPLYVFSSHNHQDHFNNEILAWSKNKVNTYYILSNDIKVYDSIDNLNIMKQDEELKLNNIIIRSFGSTDEGISFLVQIDGNNIFHAGDLNWWKWMDDTEEDAKAMEGNFKSIIGDIVNANINIDFAFFPVDTRLEENYLCGGQYFIEKLNPRYFIPMHFWDTFQTTKNFKESQNTDTKIIEINHNNELIFEN